MGNKWDLVSFFGFSFIFFIILVMENAKMGLPETVFSAKMTLVVQKNISTIENM